MRLTRAPHRHGHTLADALVGLIVATLALALTARAAGLAIRTHARTAATVQQGHDGADALDVVAARLRDVVPADDDLLDATDGALVIRRPIGTATLCGVAGDTVTLAAGDAAAPWADDWARSPVVGDELRHVDHVGGAAGVRRILALLPLDAPCAADRRPWTLRARWRVTLDGPLAPAPVGTPIRLLTRERWVAYRGGDGGWALGLAAWVPAASTFDSPQPLVAIADAAPPTFTASARDSANRPLAAGALARARTVVLTLRRHRGVDSSVIRVPTA